MGRELTRKHRFSFREFVSYLGSIDIYNCNVHYRSQVDSDELSGRIGVDRVIDLDHAIVQLAELEEELGLKKTNLKHISESKHQTTRADVEGFFRDTIDF